MYIMVWKAGKKKRHYVMKDIELQLLLFAAMLSWRDIKDKRRSDSGVAENLLDLLPWQKQKKNTYKKSISQRIQTNKWIL